MTAAFQLCPDAFDQPAELIRPAPRRTRVLEIGMRWFAKDSGGLDRVFSDLIAALPDAGMDVEGLVAAPSDSATQSGGAVTCFAKRSGLAGRLSGARREIGQAVASGRFDLVSAHFALYVAPALGRLARLPFVFHFHGPWADESRCEGGGRLATAAKFAVERAVYQRADRIIVLSRAFAELAMRRYGIAESRIRIVPGGVDVAGFASGPNPSEARRLLGWPTDRPILLCVRRMAARMGLDRLLAAMPAVVHAQPDVLLCIAGRGRLAAALEQQASALSLQNHVRFLGFVPDASLRLAFRAADINVVPTQALEGFGLTAAEALAAGTPSMVTPVGGLPEVVAELSPDLVFASAATSDIAGGLVAALRGQLRLPDSIVCAAYAASRFDRGLAAARTASVYRELVC